MKRTKLFRAFIESEQSGGFLLIAATVISLLISNSDWTHAYTSWWKTDLAGHPIDAWINDGLMSVFFLLIGLELKREILSGALSSPKKAALPVIAALGGMIVPAAIYALANSQTNFQSGSGIPMATDIAFAMGILSLLGNRVPTALKVFLMALAVIDDLGAILVIAIFYAQQVQMLYLVASLSVFGILFLLNKNGVRNLIFYIAGGILMWSLMLHSGIHPTITGVLLAVTIPFGDDSKHAPLSRLQHLLHRPVVFIILPLFALANTAIFLDKPFSASISHPIGLGIILGLVVGKPLGIWLFSWLGCRMKLCDRPRDLSWPELTGAAILGGIGFTMSIFITLLAFPNASWIYTAKTAILAASFISALIGYFWLLLVLKKRN